MLYTWNLNVYFTSLNIFAACKVYKCNKMRYNTCVFLLENTRTPDLTDMVPNVCVFVFMFLSYLWLI